MGFYPIVVGLRENRNHSGRLDGLARIGEREQHSQVAGLSEFVKLGEPGLELRPFEAVSLFELLDLGIHGVERRRGFFGFLIGAPEFLFLDLALELEPPEVAEHRPFFRRQAIGFFVERPKTFGCAGGEGLRAGLIGLLCGGGNGGEEQDREGGRLHKSCFRREIVTSADQP